jgi:hypothetical protein
VFLTTPITVLIPIAIFFFIDFQSWKYDLEQRELCNYVVLAGKKKLNTSFEMQYFVCNKSGKLVINYTKVNSN